MADSAAFIDFDEGAAPATPGVGKVRQYAKTDGSLYQKDDAGTETGLAAAGGSGLYSAYVCITDEKAQNTAGGTATSGSWQTRVLNTERTDTGGDAALASNQITLQAGTYDVYITCPGAFVRHHQARLQNITDTATLLTGTSEYTSPSETDLITTRSVIAGTITLAAAKVLEVQHQVNTTRATNGFGPAANFGTEVYTVAEFRKRA